MNAHTNIRFHFHITLNRRAPLGIFALILATLRRLSLSGCVGLTGAGTPAAKSGSTSLVGGTLSASATSLSFGNVVAGSTSPQTLTLSNTGAAAVTISQATVTGAGFSVVGGMTSVAIAAGQNHAFQVQFAPTAAGSVSGGISIASDATNSPLVISLSGTGTAALAITAQPASQTVTAGQTANFSVVATGSGQHYLSVEKEWSGDQRRNGSILYDACDNEFGNGTQFTVVVTDSSGSMTSSPATLTVTAAAVAPSITSQPAKITVTAGQTATFSVTATGTAPLTYQWKKNGTAISGATSRFLHDASDGGFGYRLQVYRNRHQQRFERDQQRRHVDRECPAFHHHAAGKPRPSMPGRPRRLASGDGYGHSDVSVEKEQRRNQRSDCGFLHNSRHGGIR